ncbi:MAG: aminotransferase class V-fold PLP-dependent enzyme, partial [Bacteroidota bacterium]
MVCQTCEAELRVVSITSDGDLDKTELRKLVDERTKLVAITHISNTLGTVNDLDEIIGIAHQVNAPVMIDAAQSAALYSLDVQALDCDFLTFSAHKAFGPFGIGILYAKPEHTKHIHPYNFGGGIVKMVSVGNTDFMPFPTCLEAGTPNISGAIGMAAGIDFIKTLDLEELRKHIHQLTSECRSALSAIDDVSVIGDPESYTGIVSFMVDDIHPHDVASFLNEDNIAVRAGMHCTQPLLSSLDVPATVRASFSIYNTMEDVDQLVVSVKELIKFWK